MSQDKTLFNYKTLFKDILVQKDDINSTNDIINK